MFFAIWNNHLLNLYYSAVITKLQYNNKKYSFNQLLANGEKVETVDVTSETNWKYEFKNLPKYDEGKKIE
ncbi:hypothetical protein B8A13_14320, partial [Staphylococcus aureus]